MINFNALATHVFDEISNLLVYFTKKILYETASKSHILSGKTIFFLAFFLIAELVVQKEKKLSGS